MCTQAHGGCPTANAVLEAGAPAERDGHEDVDMDLEGHLFTVKLQLAAVFEPKVARAPGSSQQLVAVGGPSPSLQCQKPIQNHASSARDAWLAAADLVDLGT